MRIRNTNHQEKIELQMTPMIDIVFQLLVFFVMTFKIVVPEGDFGIRMPSASSNAQEIPDEPLPVIRIRLKAGANGNIAGVSVDGVSLGNESDVFKQLRAKIHFLAGDDTGPNGASEREVEIENDYDLQYNYVIQTINAVSGYYDKETSVQHKLIEKIKFAQPKKPTE